MVLSYNATECEMEHMLSCMKVNALKLQMDCFLNPNSSSAALGTGRDFKSLAAQWIS